MIFNKIQSKQGFIRKILMDSGSAHLYSLHSGGRGEQISGTLSAEFQDCQKYTNLVLKQKKP